MNKIAFVTDSLTSMSAEYVQRYHIHVVPNILVWSGDEYRDGVDITPSEFFTRLKTSRDFPTTAAVAPNTFRELFANLLADGFDICGVFTSTTMSRTCLAAQEAKEMLGADNIIAIDSQTAAMAVGWPLILAARAADKGASLTECAALARDGLANTGGIVTVDSLEHLQRSGRLGSAQRFIGSLLNVKPILEMIDGQPALAERVRTRHRALTQLAEVTVARVNGRSPLHLSILHYDAADDAQSLLAMLQEKLELDEFFIGEGSANTAVHFGPGALSIQFMAGVPDP